MEMPRAMQTILNCHLLEVSPKLVDIEVIHEYTQRHHGEKLNGQSVFYSCRKDPHPLT